MATQNTRVLPPERNNAKPEAPVAQSVPRSLFASVLRACRLAISVSGRVEVGSDVQFELRNVAQFLRLGGAEVDMLAADSLEFTVPLGLLPDRELRSLGTFDAGRLSLLRVGGTWCINYRVSVLRIALVILAFPLVFDAFVFAYGGRVLGAVEHIFLWCAGGFGPALRVRKSFAQILLAGVRSNWM